MTAALPVRRLMLAAVGMAALAACAALAHADARGALTAYLPAYVFFLGLCLGSLLLLLVNALSGGRWGQDLRAALLSCVRVLPLLAILLLPLLLGARALYPWAAAGASGDPQLLRQHWYLNLPFFELRALACVAIWLALASQSSRLGAAANGRHKRPIALAATGLILLLLTATVSGVDWIMSLVPQWRSSAFGLTDAAGQALAACALAIIVAVQRDPPGPLHRQALGTLLFTLTLLWWYLAYTDYLTAWVADLPPETAWYLPRVATSWSYLAGAVLVCTSVSATLLLFPSLKRRRTALTGAALLILTAQALHAVWLIVPSVRPGHLELRWSDALPWVGIGALYLLAFSWRLP